MNGKRIEELDRAWMVYEEYLRAQTKCGAIPNLTFSEWLHIEMRQARCER